MNRSGFENHRFQVDLQGILDLLSNHLYSGPQVYVRELLQNAADAIAARQRLDPSHVGEVRIEIITTPDDLPTLLFEDNGIGLTENEIHNFLATIGQSSKRAELPTRPDDFIGQFGIGLLSCFMVSDEIVVITTCAKPGSFTYEWRGKTDGTYAVRRLERQLSPGTQVFLRANLAHRSFVEPERVLDLARRYGEFLACPIDVIANGTTTRINRPAPWDWDSTDDSETSRDLHLKYGRAEFQCDFLDAFPLRSRAGRIEGVAYVLPFSSGLVLNRVDRVYLKNIFCSDKAQDLLPDWAFFVRCVLNARDLRPTASRESFYQNDELEAARDELGTCLREQLCHLARSEPARLQRIIALHHVAIKALAIEDDECLRLFANWLPFETSLGPRSLEDLLRDSSTVHYAATVDQFRQIAPVAAAQAITVVNAGYIYDQQLIERLPDVFPEIVPRQLEPDSLCEEFEDVTLDEREQWFDFLRLADVCLQPFECSVDVRKFRPIEVPTLFVANASSDFLRTLTQTQDVADSFWTGVLDGIGEQARSLARTRLILNASNLFVRKIAELEHRDVQRRCIEMLYVQSLLMGHYPLREREMRLLNDGVIGLIDWAITFKSDS